jgi:hypothetical protein
MKKRFTLLTLAVLLMAGCGASPAKRYEAAARLYTGTVDALSTLRDAGEFDAVEREAITAAIKHGYLYLQQWNSALDGNEPYVEAQQSFEMVMEALLEYYMKPAERISEDVE